MTYQCPGLNGIDADRVRNIDHAARLFAHRLARKMFGRGGQAFRVARVRHGHDWVQYEADIGKRRGPRTRTMLTVSRR